MKKIFATLAFINFILMIGIIGGIEHGQSICNAIWCIPTLLCFGVFTYLAAEW